MMTSHSNAVLASHSGDTSTQPSSLCFASDVRAYSTTPTAHVRDLVADGIKPYGLAVYFAIADRQRSAKGEYFRSNESLAEETGTSKSNVQKWLSILKKKNYITVWYINGGRRMRVLTGVLRGTPTDTEGYSQKDPYKENNIKKTTQQCCVFSKLSEKHRALFGEKFINTLADTYGELRVKRGLLAFDADIDNIRTPLAWLTCAIERDFEPRKAARVGQTFTENTFEHYRIVKEFKLKSSENVEIVKRLEKEGFEEARIAYRIWEGTICKI